MIRDFFFVRSSAPFIFAFTSNYMYISLYLASRHEDKGIGNKDYKCMSVFYRQVGKKDGNLPITLPDAIIIVSKQNLPCQY